MRKLSVAVAVLLVAGLVPLAGAASNIKTYSGSIVVEDSREAPERSVVSPLSFRPTDDLVMEFLYDFIVCEAGDTCDTGTVPQEAQSLPDVYDGKDNKTGGDGPVWLHVEGQDVDPYQLSIESSDPVVGTVDVYEYRGDEGGDLATPECPWELAYQLYPDGNPVSTDYIVHLQQVTLGSHGVETPGISSPVLGSHLTLPPSVDGYIVVIDARAASGVAGNVTLDYLVESDTRFNVHPVKNHWLYNPHTLQRNAGDCLQKGVDLPQTSSLATEIPGSGGQISLQDLTGTALPPS